MEPNKTKTGSGIGWFKAKNKFIDEYARHLGPTASAVYFCLLRHLNTVTGACYPSQELIAEKLGVNRRSVIRSIKKLEEVGLILVYKSGQKSLFRHNFYQIQDPEKWIKPG